jgi:hypothetical protein
LPRVPAKVGLTKRERLLSVVGGNASSCPKPALRYSAAKPPETQSCLISRRGTIGINPLRTRGDRGA